MAADRSPTGELPMEFAPHTEAEVDEWCRAAMATPALAPDDERELAQWAECGDSEARERLVRANLRLVVEAARRHATDGATLLPLLQAGVEGLLCAIEAFDPASGERFAEHASRWIEQAVHRAVTFGEREVRE